MRRLAAALLALVLSVAVGCGDDGGGDREELLSAGEAEDAVERASLDVDDLGEGWELAETIDPGDESSDAPIDACVERGVDDSMLAASPTRKFEHEGDALLDRTHVWMSTEALDDEELAEESAGRFADDDLAGCFGDLLLEAMGGESDVPIEAGEPRVTDDYLGLDGVRSSRLTLPFHAEVADFELDAAVDVVVVSRGQLVSWIVSMQLGDDGGGEDIARWAGLLADRQRLDD